MNTENEDFDFARYYDLEDYLFNEVKGNFHTRGCLTTAEFVCIVIWKSNRAKTKIMDKIIEIGNKRRLKSLESIVKELTSQIFEEKDYGKKLDILLNEWKFYLPTAVAILTVLYPTKFTMYDYRVRNEVGLKDFSTRKECVKKYFEDYLPAVEKQGKGHTLREKDKYLWGRSFYCNLIKFLSRVN